MDLSGLYKYRKLAIFIVLLIVIITFGLQFYDVIKFHVIGTDPSVNSIGTLSPFLKVSFNKELSSKNVSISSPSGAGSSYKVQDKVLIIYLNYPLTADKMYSVDIASVYDSSGAKLSNLVFSFKPTNIPFNDLPQDEQNALVNSQDHYNIPGINITYVNTNDLINNGMSTTQLALLEKYFSEYKPSAKTVTFDPNSIGIYAATPPAVAMFKFDVSIDGTNYNAEASYTFLNNITLSLYNPQTGALVFDSDINPGGD